jgi:hypothetical protein
MWYSIWEFLKPWVCWYRCVRHNHEDVPILMTVTNDGGREYTIVCIRCGRHRKLVAPPPRDRKRTRRLARPYVRGHVHRR